MKMTFCNLIYFPLSKIFIPYSHTYLGNGMYKISFFFFSLTHCLLEYVCHGSWMENGTTFIIARHAGTKHGVCISFRPSSTDSTAAQLIIGDSCYRETMLSEIPEHHLISNVTGVVRKYRSCSSIYRITVPRLMFTVIGQFDDINAHAIQDFNRFIPSFFLFIPSALSCHRFCRRRHRIKMNR
jgi:hypothetical protein